MTASEMKRRLLYCGDPVAALDGITVSGRRLNAAKALGPLANCPVPTYTVSIATARGGTASVSPALASYPIETPITLTAAPDPGFVFAGWQINGVGGGSANPLTFPIVADLAVEPVFVRPTPFEHFDGVTAPVLPPGWTTSQTAAPCQSGNAEPWRTQAAAADTDPNAAFAGTPPCVSDKVLLSPSFAVSNDHTRLMFRHRYDLEADIARTTFFDGAVLEIAIAGGAFADIVAAGGSFLTNGYRGTIDDCCENPLGGRRGWGGLSSGWVTTVVTLPPAAAGQEVRLRWRLGTDHLLARTGWWVDSIVIDPDEPTALSVDDADGPYGGTATLSATLSANGAGVAGKAIAFTIGGAPACGAPGAPACPITGSDGVATLPAAGLAGRTIGAHPGAIGASFAGDVSHDASAGTADLIVTQAAQTISFAPLPDRTLGDPPFTVVATASSGLAATFAAGPPGVCASGGPNGATITLVGPGTCTITASQPGDTNHAPAAPVAQTFAVLPSPRALTVTVQGPGVVSPGSGDYPPGPLTLTATPDAGSLFLGWTVDGQTAGWNSQLTLALDVPRAVVATFATPPSFADVPPGDPAREAIAQLAARGVIEGYGGGRFGPDDTVLRGEIAVMIVRAIGWDDVAPADTPPFVDIADMDPEIQRAIAILAERGVMLGYGNGLAGPTDPVLQHPGRLPHHPRDGRRRLLDRRDGERPGALPRHPRLVRPPARPGDLRPERRADPRPAAEPALGRLPRARPARLDGAAALAGAEQLLGHRPPPLSGRNIGPGRWQAPWRPANDRAARPRAARRSLRGMGGGGTCPWRWRQPCWRAAE